jgi:hypothetical protein
MNIKPRNPRNTPKERSARCDFRGRRLLSSRLSRERTEGRGDYKLLLSPTLSSTGGGREGDRRDSSWWGETLSSRDIIGKKFFNFGLIRFDSLLSSYNVLRSNRLI